MLWSFWGITVLRFAQIVGPGAKSHRWACQDTMERIKQELQALNRLINAKQQPAEAMIRRWLKQRDPNFTAAEVDEHVRLVKRELAQL